MAAESPPVAAPDATEWVRAIERAYVAAATTGDIDETPIDRDGLAAIAGGQRSFHGFAYAGLGAVASHYLAVGSPRTIGIIADAATMPDAVQSLGAHRAWFAPKEARFAHSAVDENLLQLFVSALAGAGIAFRATSHAEALACDIVCVHAPIEVAAAQLRRGTHVNLLHPGATIDAELRQLATVSNELPDLGRLAAGLVDGRKLDELTVFAIGPATLAEATVARELLREAHAATTLPN